MNRKLVVATIVVALTSTLAYNYTAGTLTQPQRSALVVLIVASGFWVSEALPLAATSLLIPLLQEFLGVQPLKNAIVPFFDTTVLLLLGGFLLAVAVEKYDLDEYFAYLIVSRVKAGPRGVTLAVMLATAFLSMWISNSAATALLITMALRITDSIPTNRGNFSKIMVLGIAYSATAGGLSTLVGTTTCAMAAASVKATIGYEINFLGWMIFGMPIAFIQVFAIWLVLFTMFPTEVKKMPPITREATPLTSKQKTTLAVFAFAVVAWLTSKLPDPVANLIHWSGHGYSSATVAGVIIIVLYITSLLDETDIKNGKWATLLLIGGGLSLGSALEVSKLVKVIADTLLNFTGGGSPIITISLVTFAGLGLSIVASNTASAGIFLPIAISLGIQTGVNPIILAIAVGISTSLDFMLPVGTPPNAIAYSTGKVSMPEMIKAGILLDLTGALLTILFAYFVWPLLV